MFGLLRIGVLLIAASSGWMWHRLRSLGKNAPVEGPSKFGGDGAKSQEVGESSSGTESQEERAPSDHIGAVSLPSVEHASKADLEPPLEPGVEMAAAPLRVPEEGAPKAANDDSSNEPAADQIRTADFQAQSLFVAAPVNPPAESLTKADVDGEKAQKVPPNPSRTESHEGSALSDHAGAVSPPSEEHTPEPTREPPLEPAVECIHAPNTQAEREARRRPTAIGLESTGFPVEGHPRRSGGFHTQLLWVPISAEKEYAEQIS